jgi:crotonobetainyl-CoA:carnitine CoA-transferase CaiB-like acyl-CoA transferase
MASALAGIRVLDLSGDVAGPYCARVLADYGADVIKVEPPGEGDVARHLGPFPDRAPDPERSARFLHVNTNKRSVTLDVGKEAGAALLRTLIGRADAVVEDGALAAAAGEGWDYETLSQSHPSLVLTSISPFGPNGPYRDYRASDIVLGAMGGWMYPMGDRDRPPLQPGGPYIQYVAGLFAAAGTLTALFEAAGSGAGRQVFISMLEAAVATTVEDTVWASYTGEARGRYGPRWGPDISISLQPAKDGHELLMFGPHRDQVFTLLDMAGIPRDPALTGDEAWTTRGDELEALVQAFVRDRGVEEVFHAAQALRLPFAPVASPRDVLHSPQLRERGYFVEVEHPHAGRLEHTGPPFRMSATPGRIDRPAPVLGQDNDEVYRQLAGLSETDIARLRQQGVI